MRVEVDDGCEVQIETKLGERLRGGFRVAVGFSGLVERAQFLMSNARGETVGGFQAIHASALLVDGHNVLYGLPDEFGEHYESGHPGLNARQHLISRLDALSKLHPMLAVDLWFDGEAATDENQGRNFRVRFSGGKGANRADTQIVSHLQYLAGATPDQVRALVTADRELAMAATGCGALVIAPQELALLMG
jgi:hypothetical protein